jgi:hypothetical protein
MFHFYPENLVAPNIDRLLYYVKKITKKKLSSRTNRLVVRAGELASSESGILF